VDLAGNAAVRFRARRSATSAQLLARFGVEHGVSLEIALGGTQLTPTVLDDPAAEITALDELGLVDNLVRSLGGSGERALFGLEAGTRYHLTSYGIWGFALMSSRTLRSAIDLALRYVDLTFAFTRIGLVERRDEARLVIDDSDIPELLQHFLVDRDMAAIATIQRELVAVVPPLREVSMRHRPPDDDARYREVFGIAPRFDAPENVIAFDAAFLDVPLPQANEHTARLCEQQCRELVHARRAREGVAGRVRDKLLERPGRMPDMEATARALAMTSRTLRRHLEAESVSFRELADEVRLAIAEEMLRADAITLAEIADRLGYSDLSSFVHAFKRLAGVTPSAFRRGERGRT